MTVAFSLLLSIIKSYQANLFSLSKLSWNVFFITFLVGLSNLKLFTWSFLKTKMAAHTMVHFYVISQAMHLLILPDFLFHISYFCCSTLRVCKCILKHWVHWYYLFLFPFPNEIGCTRRFLVHATMCVSVCIMLVW